MPTLLSVTARALRSIFAPGMFSIMIMSVIVTILVLIGFISTVSGLLVWAAAYVPDATVATYLPWVGGVGAGFLAWFLFPGIMPFIVSFFDNRIASTIERYDYPAASATRQSNFWPELMHDLRFSLLVITLNILVLPLYIVPIINIFLFYLLNGYLLGREFFVMVARRHIAIVEIEHIRRRHSRMITLCGALLALGATIPVINLFAPFWGIAVMTHLYHRLAPTMKTIN